jgi:hypothetical protein
LGGQVGGPIDSKTWFAFIVPLGIVTGGHS